MPDSDMIALVYESKGINASYINILNDKEIPKDCSTFSINSGAVSDALLTLHGLMQSGLLVYVTNKISANELKK